MKILLFGTSQTNHIRELFLRYDLDVVELNEVDYAKSLLPKMKSYIGIIKGVDFVYRIYNQSKFNWRFLIARVFGKKTISHWIGTDVLEEQRNKNKIGTRINRYVTTLNLACSPLIKRELKDMGIDALEIPIVPTIKGSVGNTIPQRHAVLTYIPKGREKFYGMHYIHELARTFPDINFHIVANDNDSINLENVFFHGMLNKIEMEELYNKTTLLFRFPEHDGLSMMLLEALAKGKQVIYPYEFPYVETPKSRKLQDVLDTFEQVISKKPNNNIGGAKYVTERYKEENIINEYKKAFGIQNDKL
ncbi:MAG: hypothetical protein PHC59_15695 [Thomasclavelia ramosa]|nr:hypothetical protein [Thomasclavelia ramosa]